MAKKKKKKKEGKPEEKKAEDDGFDLQDIIKSLKDEKTDDKETPAEEKEEKSEELFVLVDEEKESGKDISKEREQLGIEKREFEEEKAKVAAEFETKLAEYTSSKKELQTVAADLLRQKDTLQKDKERVEKREKEVRDRESKLLEKQAAIKKATDLLVSQRDGLGDREKKMETLKEDLQNKAGELKEKEEKLAEFRDRTQELDQREMDIRNKEDDLRERELHIADMESAISECARCSSRDKFLSIQRLIDELKEFGFDLQDEQEELRNMQHLLDDNQNDLAISKGEALIEKLKKLKQDSVIKGINYVLTRAQISLAKAKEVEGQAEAAKDAENWINEAKEHIDKGEFKMAETYVHEAEFLLQSILRGTSAQAGAAPSEEGKTYSCPSCYTTFTVDTSVRPVRVTCPNCQIELQIKEDVSFA